MIIKLYMFLIILDAVLSYFPGSRHQEWVKKLRKIANFTDAPIRKYLPNDLPFDISPIIVIVLLNLLMLLW